MASAEISGPELLKWSSRPHYLERRAKLLPENQPASHPPRWASHARPPESITKMRIFATTNPRNAMKTGRTERPERCSALYSMACHIPIRPKTAPEAPIIGPLLDDTKPKHAAPAIVDKNSTSSVLFTPMWMVTNFPKDSKTTLFITRCMTPP